MSYTEEHSNDYTEFSTSCYDYTEFSTCGYEYIQFSVSFYDYTEFNTSAKKMCVIIWLVEKITR